MTEDTIRANRALNDWLTERQRYYSNQDHLPTDQVTYNIAVASLLAQRLSHEHIAMSEDEIRDFDLKFSRLMYDIAPLKPRRPNARPTDPDEPFKPTITAETNQALADNETAAIRAYEIQAALDAIDTSDDLAIDEAQALTMMWPLLYAAEAVDLDASIKTLADWLILAKQAIHDETPERHALIYMSRSMDDGSSCGGNGKSYIGKAIMRWYQDRNLPASKGDFRRADSQYNTPVFTDNCFVLLNELDSVKSYDTTEVKQVLEDGSYLVNEKYKHLRHEAKANAILVGSTNSQDWITNKDKAIRRRTHIININADLNLVHGGDIYNRAMAAHPLPTEAQIGEAYEQLLRVPVSVLQRISGARTKARPCTVTASARYEFAKILFDINGLTYERHTRNPHGVAPVWATPAASWTLSMPRLVVNPSTASPGSRPTRSSTSTRPVWDIQSTASRTPWPVTAPGTGLAAAASATPS